MSRVVLFDAEYEAEAIKAAVSGFLDVFHTDWKAKTVLIKPNMLSDYPPERHVTTHPSVIRQLVSMLLERGAEVIVGDNPGISGYGSNKRCAQGTGILDASLGRYRNIALDVVQVEIDSANVDSVPVSKIVLDADIVISVPKFKTHVLTTLSGAIKNHYGIVVGAQKTRMHVAGARPADFAKILVDIYAVRPPDLVLIDAVQALEGLGPVGKRTRHIGRLIGADDGVAADAVMARMMGISPKQVDHVRIAAERGLGSIDLADMELDGEVEPVPGFLLPWQVDTLNPRRLTNTRSVFRFLSKPRLKVVSSRCSACGLCVEKCPVGAVTLQKHARIDDKSCMRCFCCYEICPEDAIEIRGPLRHIIPSPDAGSGT